MTNATKEGHLKLPWRTALGSSDGTAPVRNADDDLVCSFSTPEEAAHIVHCVNTHDALVEALEALLTAPNTTEYDVALVKARTALSLAKSKA